MATVKATTVEVEDIKSEKKVSFADQALAFVLKNRNLVIGIGLGVILVIAGYFGYRWYLANQDSQAAGKMTAAVKFFEAGQYKQALDGANGLRKIAEEYGSTPSGNLAKYYTGVSLDQLNDRKNAYKYFEQYSKGDDILGAAALEAMGSIEEDINKNYAKAADLYQEAASVYPDLTTAPENLRKAARAMEAAKQYDQARSVYQSIKSQYPESAIANSIDYFLAKLDTAQGKK